MDSEQITPDNSAATGKPAQETAPRTPDTYWLLEGLSLIVLNLLGGLFVRGEKNVPKTGPVLLVSNHVSYLDPVSIGDASPRRVVFMAKAPLFDIKLLGFLLRGVDAFPVKRGEADRAAFKNTLAMLEEKRVVCIFPEGTRSPDDNLLPAESGAAVFAMKTGCPVVPVFVDGSNKVLTFDGRVRRGKITVNFGEPFYIERKSNREDAAAHMMRAIEETRDASRDTALASQSRRIYPHWTKKVPEGSRAK